MSTPRLVLVGLPGAGKSTIGRRLANALHCEVVDSDLLIEQDRGLPCGEVFRQLGEPAFRELEEEHVARALGTGGIVSLGGGAVISPATRALLADLPVVHLRVSAQEGARRTTGDANRPVVAAEDPVARYRQLQTERASFYDEVSDATVSSEGRDPRQTVAEVLHILESLEEERAARQTTAQSTSAQSTTTVKESPVTDLRRVHVATDHPYDVVIGRDLTGQVADAVPGAAKAVILHQPPLAELADRVAAGLRAAGIDPVLYETPDAEDAKTVSGAAACWDVCAAAGLSRQDIIVGVGGGAATDLAGFIAATWMRGIRVVQYPTTLLAMVDAAVGGKTGINTAAGKNLVGSFHEPAAVLVDLDVLDTLPIKEITAGSAEIIKAGFIRDPRILDIYEADPAAALDPRGALPELIELSVKVKADVVGQDLRESSLREILNYGHTYGHAIEQHENYRWRHGWAVAVGMVYEAELAHAAGLLGADAVARHRRILTSVGLPTSYDGAPLDVLLEVMGRDKKNRDGHLRIVVLSDREGLPYAPVRLEGPEAADLQAAYDATLTEHADQEAK
ncbi:3-dehydroquinate synthase [Corynebacterium terpenotabidum]|uniref:Multifunctional fusion protein n=1 Tax=Corynebacterium terpenotabidum Y-11 TaxID=1200352 RepID=S4XJV1_9CORY|nr:3-dehydroquinate synthase [Corynebacterium terpenotabidum]AGP30843.1 3-dehydroquinate synthase [Corynebacterium terpenotabidum Y-11]